MRLYVIGEHGQVARSLRQAVAGDDSIVLGHSARTQVDLTSPKAIGERLAEFHPDVVVNPAAYTAVDRAESEPDLAFAINEAGAASVAIAAARQNVPIIHLSTDYVFDGTKKTAYVEDDAVNPQTVYGRSKLAGERAVAAANPKHIVLRTSWVYAPFGANFVRTMLRLAAERDRLRVVDDQTGCPTYAPDIATAIIAMARQIGGGGWKPEQAGVCHLAGPDQTTWFDFATAVVGGAAARGSRAVPVDPIATSDYPTPAARPANSALATVRLAAVFGMRLPPFEASLADCLDRLLNNRTGEQA